MSIALSLCLFFLSGCDFLGTGSENLSYPVPGTLEKEVSQILRDSTGEAGYTLAYARRGRYQSPVVYRDIDHDGKDEIIVSYLPSGSGGSCVYTLILKTDENGKLYRIGDLKGYSDRVDKIEFSDFDGDGREELIFGYESLIEDYPSNLCIYRYNGESYNLSYVSNCYDFLCVDLNGDGREELLNINYSELTQSASALMIVFDSTTGIFSTVVGGAALRYSPECYRIATGQTESGQGMVCVTTKEGSLLKSTEIILWDSAYSLPRNISLDSGGRVTSRYLYYGDVVAQDIDGDGFIEFPVSSVVDETQIGNDITSALGNGKMERPQYPYSWYSIRDGYPTYDFSCYINSEIDYYIRIDNPELFSGLFAYMNNTGDMIFYTRNEYGDLVWAYSVIASPEPPASEENLITFLENFDIYLILSFGENAPSEVTVSSLRNSLCLGSIFTVRESD